MKKQTANLPEDCLLQLGFHKKNTNRAGVCYEPPKELGEGHYWYYERKNMFSIGIIDLCLRQDKILEYQQPDFISLSYYDTISAEEFSPYRRLSANCIFGHVSNRRLFRAKYYKNEPIRGVELMFMPEYYQDYLARKYPGEFANPKTAFRSMTGVADFPNLVLLMRQIESFQGDGMAAHLFYESKAAEAVSLIIEKTEKYQDIKPGLNLTRQDLRNLEAVKRCIEDHYARDIRTEQLTRIACMGQTKLRDSFKRLYGCTITEYLQNRRIDCAEYLLLKTDLSIGQIAAAVGYQHAGRFAELFRRRTGLLPNEYRQLMKADYRPL